MWRFSCGICWKDHGRSGRHGAMPGKRSILIIAGAAAVVLTAGWLHFFDKEDPAAAEEHPFQHTEEAARKVSGFTVFEGPDGIYRQEIGHREAERILEGARYPRISPQGDSLACLLENTLTLLPFADLKPVPLVEVDRPRTLCWIPETRHLLYSDGSDVKRLEVDTGRISRMPIPGPVYEINATENAARVAMTVKSTFGYEVRVFDLTQEKAKVVGKGCSANLTPNGALATVLRSDHRMLDVYRWETGERILGVSAPGSWKFDNQYWSNHPDWLVSETEGTFRQSFIHHVPSDTAYQVTYDIPSGRPDLFIRP